MVNVNREVFKAQNDRAEAKKVMILLTDGHVNVDEDPTSQLVTLGRRSSIGRFLARPRNIEKSHGM